MKEELLDLLYEYSIKGKLADKDYIDKFILIVSKYKSFNDYLIGPDYIPYSTANKDTLATYSFSIKKIQIFYKKIEEVLANDKLCDVMIPEKEKIFYKNVKISQILLHELEHVNQTKIIEEKNNLEARILRLTGVGKSSEIFAVILRKMGYNTSSIESLLDNKKNIYHKYYDYAPHERLAEIKSHEQLTSITSKISDVVPTINKIEEIYSIKNMLKGYKIDNILISPTVLYLVKQGEIGALKRFEWYGKNDYETLHNSKKLYDLEDRVRLGLPIDQKEYNTINKRLNKLVSRL